MLREDFIAQMIAELTRQKDNDEDSFNQPRISSPKEIFQSLCYDFPVISTEELVILSKDISNFAASSADSQPLDTFWLNDKFVENLQYLSAFASSTNDTGRDKAVSSLCAAVFLMLPLRLLSMRRRELSTFLGGLSSCSDQPGQSYNFSIMPSGDIMLTWQEICLRYRYFVMQGTASLVSGVDAAALTGKRGGGLGGYDTCDGGYLEYLISAIKSVKWDGNVTRLGKNDYDSQTLGQCLLFNSEKDSKADMAHDDSSISLDPATMTASTSTFAGGGNTQIDVAECAVISGMAKDVWVHLSLLCRDLLVQYPEVLGLGSALSSVLGAVLPPDGALTPSTSFPTAAECMFVLILAGVVSGLSAPSALLVRGINLNASTHEDNVTVDNMEGRRETLSIRASHFQKARAGVLNYLDTFSSPTPMVAVVTICERMSRHSSNSDGAMLLSDITSVYASDVGYTATRIHDRLLTSRAVSALVHMWIEIVNDYFSASSLEVASATAMTSARAAASRWIVFCHDELSFFLFMCFSIPQSCRDCSVFVVMRGGSTMRTVHLCSLNVRCALQYPP